MLSLSFPNMKTMDIEDNECTSKETDHMKEFWYFIK